MLVVEQHGVELLVALVGQAGAKVGVDVRAGTERLAGPELNLGEALGQLDHRQQLGRLGRPDALHQARRQVCLDALGRGRCHRLEDIDLDLGAEARVDRLFPLQPKALAFGQLCHGSDGGDRRSRGLVDDLHDGPARVRVAEREPLDGAEQADVAFRGRVGHRVRGWPGIALRAGAGMVSAPFPRSGAPHDTRGCSTVPSRRSDRVA